MVAAAAAASAAVVVSFWGNCSSITPISAPHTHPPHTNNKQAQAQAERERERERRRSISTRGVSVLIYINQHRLNYILI